MKKAADLVSTRSGLGWEQRANRRKHAFNPRTIEIVLVLSLFCYFLFNFGMLMHTMNHSNPSKTDLPKIVRCDIENPPHMVPKTAGHAVANDVTEDVVSAAKKHVHLNGVYEMPQAEPPSFYMMIPSVPRANNEDYLLKVLSSVENFPNDRIFVFHNGKPEQDHLRWEEARSQFPKMHFIRNEAQAPPGHASIYNLTLPLPGEIQNFVDRYNDTEVMQARQDSLTRKKWRLKECFDFTLMSRYVVDTIIHADAKRLNSTWIIFNQDDAVWKVPALQIQSTLTAAQTLWVELFNGGMVSVAFRYSFLIELIGFADLWCDFKPVDWMLWSFTRSRGYRKESFKQLIDHIGKISSRMGVVEGEQERMEAALAKQKQKIESARLRKKEQLEQQQLKSKKRQNLLP